MTLRIDKSFNGTFTVLRLIGELRSSETGELKPVMSEAGSSLTLDLKELNVVDLSGIQFLIDCESRGTAILHCPPYIREWMKREREREKED